MRVWVLGWAAGGGGETWGWPSAWDGDGDSAAGLSPMRLRARRPADARNADRARGDAEMRGRTLLYRVHGLGNSVAMDARVLGAWG